MLNGNLTLKNEVNHVIKCMVDTIVESADSNDSAPSTTENNEPRGRKRVRKTEIWKQNIRKKKKTVWERVHWC